MDADRGMKLDWSALGAAALTTAMFAATPEAQAMEIWHCGAPEEITAAYEDEGHRLVARMRDLPAATLSA